MPYALNNTTAPAAYSPASTLYCLRARRLNLDVTNAAIYYQLGSGGGDPAWGPEFFMTPSFRGLDRAFDAVRFRAANTSANPQAQVTLAALTAPDIG